MAPDKAKASRASPAWYEPALSVPTISEENLPAACRMMVGDDDEGRVVALRAGSAKPEATGSTFRPFFLNSMFAGLVPHFSSFFYVVLSH